MKKLISIFAVFLLVMQTLPMITGANDIFVYDISKPAELFDTLGIIDYNAEISSDSKISKGEFVSLLVRFAGYVDNGFSVDLPYKDVYKGHEYISEISYAFEMGAFNDDWDVLYPDDNLTMYFASEVLKNILGYNKLSDSDALKVQKYLTENIITEDDNVLNMGMAYEILYRTTNVPVVEEYSYNPFGIKYRVSDITLLDKYFNIKKVSGRVTRTSMASFDSEHSSEFSICIDGVGYRTESIKPADFFGRYVDAYFEDLGNEKLVKHVMLSKKNKEVVISADEFDSFSNDVVTYYKGNKTISVNTESPLIVYNGEDVSGTEYSQSLFDIDDGSVTLVYNDKEKCDLILIEEYENMLVNLVDLENEVIYSKNVEDEPIVYKDSHLIEFFVYNGETVEKTVAESISANSLITYSKSLNNKCIKIYLSTKVVNSQVTQIENDENGNPYSVVINENVKYMVSGNACMLGISNVKVGSYYNIHLTFLNNIGAFTLVDDESDLFGFIAKTTGPHRLSGVVQCKIITNLSAERTGEMIFTLNNSVTIDGQKQSAKNALNIIKSTNAQTVNVPIVFRLNSENKIKYIDTPYYDQEHEPEDSLRPRVFGSKFPERVQVTVPKGYTNLLAQRYFVPLTGLVVITPEGNVDEIRKMPYIPSKAVTASSGYYTKNIKAYSLGDKTAICPIVVWVDNQADTESTLYENKIYLVESVSDVLYEDEERISLVLNNGASSAEYLVNSDIPIAAMSTVQAGDVARVSFNSYNEIDGLEIMVHGRNPYEDVGYVFVHNTAKENGNTPYLMGHEFRVAIGLVKSVEYDATTDKHYVTYMLGNNPADAADIEATYVIDSAKSYKVMNRTGEIEISPIVAANIKTYDSVGTQADVVIVRYEFCVPITQYFVTK